MLPLGEEARWMDGSPSLGQHDQNRQAEKKGRKDLVMEEAERRKGRKGGGGEKSHRDSKLLPCKAKAIVNPQSTPTSSIRQTVNDFQPKGWTRKWLS